MIYTIYLTRSEYSDVRFSQCTTISHTPLKLAFSCSLIIAFTYDKTSWELEPSCISKEVFPLSSAGLLKNGVIIRKDSSDSFWNSLT